MIHRRLASVVATAAIVVAACGGGATAKPSFSLPTSIGEGEGELTVLAWPGYAENGSTDEPWVTWFPVEFTFHNINHFEGPGGLTNLYLRTRVHVTFDRSTGEVKVEMFKDEVLCR